MSDPSSTLEAAFWQKPSTGRETITILRDGLSNGQPIMVRGEVVEPQIKVRFTLKDGSHKDVTVETKNSNQIETLFFEVSDKCMLQSYKTLPYGKKTCYSDVNVIGATKFEVLSGMKLMRLKTAL
ncbi:hypothetical protein AB6A40_007766 [Gnathostoma spinigerum]|uniref:Uncharacterized protein n=1 Tax=Gnathostoma spinigerum TaxID=75299 RepID=A0ABD6EPF2_9BILA